MKKFLFTLTMTGLFVFPLAAQENANGFFTAAVGAGFTTPVYRTGSAVDTGWNVQAQAGINLFGAHAGIVGEFDFNDMGINSNTLQNAGYPGGSTYITDVTVDPIIRLNPNGRVGFYLIGGPGIYHRHVDYTEPAAFTGFNPFFGNYYVPGNQVVLAYGTTKLGVNGGAGVNFRLGSGKGKFFAEARYNEMFTYHPTAYIPVTFGFRW